MDNAKEAAKVARVNHELRNSKVLLEIDNNFETFEQEATNHFDSMMSEHHKEEIRRLKPAPIVPPSLRRRNQRVGKSLNWDNPDTFSRMLDKSGDFGDFRFAGRGRNVLAPLSPRAHGLSARKMGSSALAASTERLRLNRRYLNAESGTTNINTLSKIE